MLKVQEYLRSGNTLENLKRDFAIGGRVDEKLNVVSLNYSMIESPMSNPIVQECRCLILEIGTWNVKGITYNKFFNYGEGHIPEDFDWSNFKTYEKLDGSIIAVWFHDTYGWQIATRSVPDGSSQVDDSGLTYRDLVIMTLKDMGSSWETLQAHMDPKYTYIYELMTPENQVVVLHKDRKLVLTGIRSTDEPWFKESDLDIWHGWNPGFPVPVVNRYEGFSKDVVLFEVQGRNPLEHEGFVLVDKNFNRVKVKSDAYCLMSHQRDGLGKSNKARLELVLTEKDDDVMQLLPEFVQDKIKVIKQKLGDLVTQVNEVYNSLKHIESQKDFALEACKYRFSGALFAIRAKRVTSALEWFKQASPKSTLDYLNLKETEAGEE